MTVSVIVPVYKAERWIGQCRKSIDAQTYKGIEQVFVEDHAGAGAGATRNRGIALSRGEFIVFCDADDYLEPDAVERMVEAMQGVDMIVGSFRKFGAFEQIVTHETRELTVREVAKYALQNMLHPMQHQMLSGCWAKMYRRDLVGGFPNLSVAEDMAFNFDYLTRCAKVRFLSDVVYNNRKRSGSLSTTFDANDKFGLFDFVRGLDYVRAFLSRHFPANEVERAIDDTKVYLSMLAFMRICEQQRRPMREVLKGLYA